MRRARSSRHAMQSARATDGSYQECDGNVPPISKSTARTGAASIPIRRSESATSQYGRPARHGRAACVPGGCSSARRRRSRCSPPPCVLPRSFQKKCRQASMRSWALWLGGAVIAITDQAGWENCFGGMHHERVRRGRRRNSSPAPCLSGSSSVPALRYGKMGRPRAARASWTAIPTETARRWNRALPGTPAGRIRGGIRIIAP